MVNFIDPDRDLEADPEVLMISGTFRGIYAEIDMENVKMKEEKKNRLSGNG